MKPTYRVKDWAEHFETSETRKLKSKSIRFVTVQNKHDGKSYRRVAAHPEAVAVFCAWNLILQVASKMPERGTLADGDGPLDADDLSMMTGFPVAIFEAAFRVLVEPRIGWLEVVQPAESTPTLFAVPAASEPPAASRDLPASPGASRDLPASPGASRKPPDEGNRTAGNGKDRTHSKVESLSPRAREAEFVCACGLGYSWELLTRYAAAKKLGEGWVAKAFETCSSHGAVRVWLEEREAADTSPLLDPRQCPDCEGRNYYYPAGPAGGVAKCPHAGLLAALGSRAEAEARAHGPPSAAVA